MAEERQIGMRLIEVAEDIQTCVNIQAAARGGLRKNT
jgi:hypothetical protein